MRNRLKCVAVLAYLQRFWRAGGSSSTAQSRVCCCSLWAARLNRVETKVWYSSEFIPVWCVCVCPWLKVNGRHLSSIVHLSEKSYNLLVTSTIEMAVVYRSDPHNFANIYKKAPPVLIFVCVCVFAQRCPAERIVAASVPLRERSVGRCALRSGHRPGFWWAEGGAAGNVWPGPGSFFLMHFYPCYIC